MSSYIHFTEEQKEQARQTDICDLLQRQGEKLKRSGREYEWRDGSQKVTIRGNLWFHQYERVGGDAIDFVRKYMNKSYPEAMEYLLGGINADGVIEEAAKAQVHGLLRRSFRPEFLNRLDEIVFYKPLTKEDVTRIIDLLIGKLNERLAPQQIRVELTQKAKAFIVEEAYDPEFGARPLRRYVQHTVETMLSRELLRGDLRPGSTVTVDEDQGQLILQI